jgi:hypothetical protein
MTPIIIRGHTRWNRRTRGIAAGLPVAVAPTVGSEVVGPRLGDAGELVRCVFKNFPSGERQLERTPVGFGELKVEQAEIRLGQRGTPGWRPTGRR